MKKKIGDPKVALKLFLYFFRIGWFTFGGGFSIIAQMQKDFVDKKKLVTEETILDQTSIGRSLPGLMVANVAYLFGFSQGGLIAGLASVAGILTPPIVLLALVTMCYTAFRDNVYVARALVGVRAAVPPIIAGAALRLRKGAFAGGRVFVYRLRRRAGRDAVYRNQHSLGGNRQRNTGHCFFGGETPWPNSLSC